MRIKLGKKRKTTMRKTDFGIIKTVSRPIVSRNKQLRGKESIQSFRIFAKK